MNLLLSQHGRLFTGLTEDLQWADAQSTSPLCTHTAFFTSTMLGTYFMLSSQKPTTVLLIDKRLLQRQEHTQGQGRDSSRTAEKWLRGGVRGG